MRNSLLKLCALADRSRCTARHLDDLHLPGTHFGFATQLSALHVLNSRAKVCCYQSMEDSELCCELTLEHAVESLLTCVVRQVRVVTMSAVKYVIYVPIVMLYVLGNRSLALGVHGKKLQ